MAIRPYTRNTYRRTRAGCERNSGGQGVKVRPSLESEASKRKTPRVWLNLGVSSESETETERRCRDPTHSGVL